MTNVRLLYLDFRTRQNRPNKPPRKILGSHTLGNVVAIRVKRLHCLRKSKAEMRSTDPSLRSMRGQAQVVHLSAIKKADSFFVSTLVIGCASTERRGYVVRRKPSQYVACQCEPLHHR
jgi:hypothetical protein